MPAFSIQAWAKLKVRFGRRGAREERDRGAKNSLISHSFEIKPSKSEVRLNACEFKNSN
jgi:hypothetical protein